MRKFINIFLLILLTIAWTTIIKANESYIHHEIEVTLDPSNHNIKVKDQITLPASLLNTDIHFLMHQDLSIELLGDHTLINSDSTKPEAKHFGLVPDKFNLPENISVNHYTITSPQEPSGPFVFTIHYQGPIYHPIAKHSEEYARSFSETPGIISEEGIYLAGSSYWLPWFNDQLVTFNLTAKLPEAWDAVSQGKRTIHEKEQETRKVRWESPEPMDEVFLIAAVFSEYQQNVGNVQAMAFLRSPDENLAQKYLITTAQYLEMYRQLIGPFPYSKFALIENFWETGYGMPSFTLLGPKVIRFPFILHSSYPHELLHNWWGNSVFVDYDSGNWCEGLTVFLADHLIKEQRGQGVEYRRTALQAFTDYVNENNDIPLSAFRSRHDAATSAIGYNKSMMLFNMLRQEMGDQAFKKSLQKFYTKNKFKKASFDDIREAFEAVTGEDHSSFFKQWVTRRGAPKLKVSNVVANQQGQEYRLSFTLSQTQEEDVFKIQVPLAVHLHEISKVSMHTVHMTQRNQSYQLDFSNRPLLIEVDPQFDVLRRLDYKEIPPALSQLFGANKVLIVLPAKTEQSFYDGYKNLAQTWAASESKSIKIIDDRDISDLPSDQAVWIFGKENRFSENLNSHLDTYKSGVIGDSTVLINSRISNKDKSIIITTRTPNNTKGILAWLFTTNNKAFTGLGRKLPHYGKYSYLAFEGDEPTNVIKGQWPAVNSPMHAVVRQSDGANFEIIHTQLPQRTALANLAPIFSEQNLIQHVNYLASAELQGRGLGSSGLDQAAEYIAGEFNKIGLQAGGDSASFFQIWRERGGKDDTELTLKNVIGILPGKKPGWENQSVVVCAHYDHLGLGWPDVREGNEGKIHFGADDNASGVAVLLELAKIFASVSKPDRTIVFAAFTGEESGLKGSKYYIKNMKKYPVEKIMGVINLDTVGRLGSNKISVINSSSASEWKHIAMGIGYVSGLQYELVAQDLDASDQASFITAGIPAIQLFSGAHFDYHKPSDTAQKIDPGGMVKIATFSKEAVQYLSEREEPLTFTGKTHATGSAPKMSGKPRRASTGIMPDFAYSGVGVRVAAVSPQSPAALAGIKDGDVIIQFAKSNIQNLKQYAAILRQHAPGDKVSLILKRGEKEISLQIELTAR
jgi:hypothetical protein